MAGRPLLVNHWATWCTGCVDELPLLVELRARHRGTLDFIAVGWEGFQGMGDPEQQLRSVESVAERAGIDWPTLVFEGTPEMLFRGLDLRQETIPQTHLITPDGRVVFSAFEPLDESAIAQIEAFL